MIAKHTLAAIGFALASALPAAAQDNGQDHTQNHPHDKSAADLCVDAGLEEFRAGFEGLKVDGLQGVTITLRRDILDGAVKFCEEATDTKVGPYYKNVPQIVFKL